MADNPLARPYTDGRPGRGNPAGSGATFHRPPKMLSTLALALALAPATKPATLPAATRPALTTTMPNPTEADAQPIITQGDGAVTIRPPYPKLKTVDVVDDYHGTKVADPFRWLEDADSPETRAFIVAENDIAEDYVNTAARPGIRKRLEQLIDYPRVASPEREKDRLFYGKNSGLQNQSVLYTKLAGGEERVLLDPNTWSADGTVALADTTVSRDAETMAYGVSVGGSDEKQIKIMDLRDGKLGEMYPETLEHMRFSGLAFHPDGGGFWYNQYPAPGTVPAGQERLNNKVYWHRLERDQKDDREVYADASDPELSFYPSVTPHGTTLLLYASRGTDNRNGLLYKHICCDPGMTGGFTELFKPGDAQYAVVDDPGDNTLVVLTNKNAPHFKLVKIDLASPNERDWKTLLPEPQEAGTILDSVARAGDRYVAEYMQDAKNVLRHYALDGTDEKEIALPTVGTVSLSAADYEHDDLYFTFTSFTYPATPFRYDLKSGEMSKFAEPGVRDFDPEQYETKQVFYASKDGTKVPMFVTHKKGLALDGTNPTILYGYGGFNISLTPGFSSLRLAWLEQGGVYAMANLRGGGEYGEPWHAAGMLHNKQNVFDDLHAAAEYLQKQGYTSKDKLAIQGGSNGGLLVAASEVERPELYGAVICQVPVIDMFRYQLWGTGRFWTVEYGDAIKSEADFKTLAAYSPLHNIKAGVAYPPTLVLTADGDDRVVPYNAFKFVATMQATDPDVYPILLRHDVGSGHGAGKPISKALDEQADIYAFLARALGMDWQGD